MKRAGVPDVAALLAHELLPRGVVGSLDLPGPVHTLLRPILADRSARAFFAGGKDSPRRARVSTPQRSSPNNRCCAAMNTGRAKPCRPRNASPRCAKPAASVRANAPCGSRSGSRTYRARISIAAPSMPRIETRRAVLGDFRPQCEKDPATAERCRRERAGMEQRLGDLSVDVAPAVPSAPH
jgi:hypothetical protein